MDVHPTKNVSIGFDPSPNLYSMGVSENGATPQFRAIGETDDVPLELGVSFNIFDYHTTHPPKKRFQLPHSNLPSGKLT